MRHGFVPALTVATGVAVLIDYAIANPTLDTVGTYLLRYIVALAAAAGVAGGVEVAAAQVERLRQRRADPLAPIVTLIGIVIVLAVGFYPGSSGASDPVMRWVVGALIAPLVASLFSLLFFFALSAITRGLRLRTRETFVIAAAAAVMVVLLLPLGGGLGSALAGTAAWAIDVPVGAVFRGLLIGVAIATAVAAGRALLMPSGDE